MVLKFAIFGASPSEFGTILLRQLLQAGLLPEYVLTVTRAPKALAASAAFIDTRRLPDSGQQPELWDFDPHDANSIEACCATAQISFLVVAEVNGRKVREILAAQPVDVLLLADSPGIRGSLLYLPRYCVLNIHHAPLLCSRRESDLQPLDCDELPEVSAHVVTAWPNEGPILRTKGYAVSEKDSRDEIIHRAQLAAADLAVETLLTLDREGFRPRLQRLWEGRTYHQTLVASKTQWTLSQELNQGFRDPIAREENGVYAA